MAILPPNVQAAVKVLRGMEHELGRVSTLESPTLVLVPGPIPAPEMVSLPALDTSGIPRPVVRAGVRWPETAYNQWRQAWEILMAYTGWWGDRAAWPLGDGLRAQIDPVEAMKLPPVGGALAKLVGVLTLVESAVWKPDIRITAVIAPVFLLGAIYFAARRLGDRWYVR